MCQSSAFLALLFYCACAHLPAVHSLRGIRSAGAECFIWICDRVCATLGKRMNPLPVSKVVLLV